MTEMDRMWKRIKKQEEITDNLFKSLGYAWEKINQLENKINEKADHELIYEVSGK